MQPFEPQQLPIDDIQWDSLIPLIGKATRSLAKIAMERKEIKYLRNALGVLKVRQRSFVTTAMKKKDLSK